MIPLLALVSSQPELPAEQLLLNPVARFVEVEIHPPMHAYRLCRRPPRPRQPPIPYAVLALCRPRRTVGLLEYRPHAIKRPTRLVVLGQRRPDGSTVSSYPPEHLTQPEYDALLLDEAELQEAGVLDERPVDPPDDPECIDTIASGRPCPWVSCSHNLFMTKSVRGFIRPNHPGLEVEQLPETCTFRFVRNHPEGATIEQVAEVLGVTLEWTRQAEVSAFRKISRRRPDLRRTLRP